MGKPLPKNSNAGIKPHNPDLILIHERFQKHMPATVGWMCKDDVGRSLRFTQCGCGNWYIKISSYTLEPLYGDVSGFVIAKYPELYGPMKEYFARIQGTSVHSLANDAVWDVVDWSCVVKNIRKGLQGLANTKARQALGAMLAKEAKEAAARKRWATKNMMAKAALDTHLSPV